MAKESQVTSARPKRIVHDYYRVWIPSVITSDPDERATQAILEARERSKIYFMPAEWRVTKDDGENVTVRRSRYAVN